MRKAPLPKPNPRALYCYLTTTGRTSGRPREIEIWFALKGGTAYLLSGYGARSHWVRNLVQQPAVRLRIGGRRFDAFARIVRAQDEAVEARRLVMRKYAAFHEMGNWANRALPVAVELVEPVG
jgi:deazaflavin-dependent oxidoreductase (nitroreductase family)